MLSKLVVPVLLSSCCALAACGGGPAANQSPVAAFIVDTLTGTAPQEINFDASASADGDGVIASFEWDFNGDGTIDRITAIPTVEFIYETGGQITARLRVIDNAGAAAITTRTITIETLTFSDSVVEPGADGYTDDHISAAVLGSRPAVVYSSDEGLRFVLAADTTGTAWSAPVTVTPTVAGEAQLWSISNTPAVGYLDTTTGALMLVSALDQQGTAWNAPLVVVPVLSPLPGSLFPDFTFFEVDGRPAVIYELPAGANSEVHFLRSNDASGLDWSSAALELLDGQDISDPVPVVAGGNPALFFDQGIALNFMRADDAQGSSWPTTSLVVQADRSDRDGRAATAQLDGRPALVYGGDEGAFLLQSTDPLGTSFTELRLPGMEDDAEMDQPQLAFFNGQAVVAGTFDGPGQPSFMLSTDATATVFSNPVGDPNESTDDESILVLLDSGPALLYLHNSGLMKLLRAEQT